MKLFREEDLFLRHWMYDEVHYQDGEGPAKRLQLQHRVPPADIAVLIAASIPDSTDQEQAGLGPPPVEPPTWPWPEDRWAERFAKAQEALAEATPETGSVSEINPNSRLRPTRFAGGGT